MKKYFITGLVTLLPLAVTIWVAHFIIDFLTKPFVGMMRALAEMVPIGSLGFISKESFIRVISPFLVLIWLFFVMLFLGFVARRFFFKHMIRFGDRLLYKIPLVNKVYKTSKEIVKALFGSSTGSFKQVVMIPFPYHGCYCIGLIARDAPVTCSNAEHDQLVSVFVPTTPNPTTGFLVMSHKSELIHLNMKSEEAIKYIVSCGVIQPEGVAK
ncbi:MAG TPA: DUF502 domain-containing protein [Chlamydiales bacterium]|nr:DUF502 domain-containing protein [Chlamydiales bacterium]